MSEESLSQLLSHCRSSQPATLTAPSHPAQGLVVRAEMRGRRKPKQDTMVEPGYYQNAMALVRHYGKPTFFITMTLDESRDLFGGQKMKYLTQYHVIRGA